MRLRSIVYKLIPGLYAKEQHKSTETKAYLNGSTHSSIVKNDKHRLNDAACSEDESLSKQYFYDQDDPIR